MSISIMAVFLPFIIDRLAPDALTKRSANGDVWYCSPCWRARWPICMLQMAE
jgi:hypothetical protein